MQSTRTINAMSIQSDEDQCPLETRLGLAKETIYAFAPSHQSRRLRQVVCGLGYIWHGAANDCKSALACESMVRRPLT